MSLGFFGFNQGGSKSSQLQSGFSLTIFDPAVSTSSDNLNTLSLSHPDTLLSLFSSASHSPTLLPFFIDTLAKYLSFISNGSEVSLYPTFFISFLKLPSSAYGFDLTDILSVYANDLSLLNSSFSLSTLGLFFFFTSLTFDLSSDFSTFFLAEAFFKSPLSKFLLPGNIKPRATSTIATPAITTAIILASNEDFFMLTPLKIIHSSSEYYCYCNILPLRMTFLPLHKTL